MKFNSWLTLSWCKWPDKIILNIRNGGQENRHIHSFLYLWNEVISYKELIWNAEEMFGANSEGNVWVKEDKEALSGDWRRAVRPRTDFYERPRRKGHVNILLPHPVDSQNLATSLSPFITKFLFKFWGKFPFALPRQNFATGQRT
jgi:hypothetical protein